MTSTAHKLPRWKAVHEQFRRWRDAGLWERVGQALREEGR